MKLKKEYIILSGIIVVLLVYLLFFTGENRMSYRVPRLGKIEKEEINKIEITRREEKIVLTGKEENWKIMPQEYPADFEKISDMLEVIENLTLTELAAEKKDYRRYELDEEKKIQVKAYKEDKLVREFDIGKTSPTYNHTFVRVKKDPRIYHARDSFRSTFDYDRNELRDKTVLRFDKSEISEIEIGEKGKTFRFVKKMKPVEAKPEEEKEGEKPREPKEPEEEETWVMPDGKEGNKSELSSLLSDLSHLECDQFIEGKTKDDFKDPVYSVSLKGAKTYTLLIFAKEKEEDGKYPAVSSESPYPFLLSTWDAEDIMKKPEDLTKKED